MVGGGVSGSVTPECPWSFLSIAHCGPLPPVTLPGLLPHPPNPALRPHPPPAVGSWARVDNKAVIGEDVVIRDEIYMNGAIVLPHKEIKESNLDPGTIIM